MARGGILRRDRQTLGGLAILVVVGCLIALTWFGTHGAIVAQRLEASTRVSATVTGQAFAFADQVGRQILAIDQTLRILVDAQERDPTTFDLEAWRARAVVLTGLSRDLLLLDENGIVRQSSVPEAIGLNMASQPFFQDLVEHAADQDRRLFIGSATIGTVLRQWHLDTARGLRNADGSFAGAILTDYRTAAISDLFAQAELGAGSLITIVGLNDGKLRAAIGPASIDPDASIVDSEMFQPLRAAPSGIWVGPSSTDAALRIHAFQQVPGRDLAVIVGLVEQEAMRPAYDWQFQARLFASCITLLLLLIGVILLRQVRHARRREDALAEDRAVLAASYAQLEVARARADAKSEQLEATLAGMTDGVAMVDAHLCLVEWNARFPEVAGIPSDILRVGQPMEEILRAQARAGQFGPLSDIEAEVERRIARLRTGRFGTSQRQRPDGRTLELRRNRLPDGGFVTLYADITEHKRAEAALKEARLSAEAANAAKSRFVAIVSHEIRTPLNALLNTLRLLADSGLPESQQPLLTMARQSGDALSSLINDILDMSRMEAGQLTLRPSLFDLRGLLAGSLDMFQGQAAERGITLNLSVGPTVPVEMFTDPGRLRQVLLNLLSNAVKFAVPGEVRLQVDSTRHAATGLAVLRLSVKDRGPIIPEELRDRLFRAFSRLERPEGDEAAGTGLGLAICQHIVSLMNGEIGCATWIAPDGVPGNEFWLEVPLAALPAQPEHRPTRIGATELETLPPRKAPRTRILLVEDVPANQIVTATLLRREGHMVDIAGSGEAAVRAAAASPYDLIFMDIFMPGMSGPEATQRIRALPGPTRGVPIIALTGSVSGDDEDTFRLAGMNGVLAKPVSLPELLETIGRRVWFGHPGGVLPTPETMAPLTEDEAMQNLLAMDRVNELRANLPPQMVIDLIEECLGDLEARLPALRASLHAGVPSSIVAHSHAMVGMAAGYGMASLEAVLRGIMDKARDDDVDDIKEAAAEVEIELSRSAAALREVLKKELVPTEGS